MGPDDLDADRAAAALMWWAEAGVGFTVSDTPVDRFAAQLSAAEPAAPAREAPTARQPSAPFPASSPAPATRAPLIVGARAEGAAAERAAAAQDLAGLREAMESFDGCALRKTATQLVFSDGVPGSRVMFVGEGPGGDEDRIGRPFVGRAGQLLDRMLAAIGLDRTKVYIANVVPWRPPGNRTPTPEETQTCLPFIRRQIAFASPEILVCLGAHSAQTLLAVKSGITRARGSWMIYDVGDGRTIPAIAMLHPAYLLRTPSQKRAAWADMRTLAAALREDSSPAGER